MSSKPVGYLVHHPNNIEGEPGIGYDYNLAGNGVWITSKSDLLLARVLVAECQVRGLQPLEPYAVLRMGKIPGKLFDLAVNTAIVRKEKEVYFAITWKDRYHLFLTVQEGKEATVKYNVLENTVMDLHSHGVMAAWFSGQDNSDEQGLKLYGVLGNLDKMPRVSIRVGVYGYFMPLEWSSVFDGTLNLAIDTFDNKLEEVEAIELHRKTGEYPEAGPGGFWWHRFFGR